MDKETNVQRVMKMLFSICGCSDEEGLEVIEEVKKRIKGKRKEYLIDINLLKKAKQRGFCLCELKKNEDNSNVCPCNKFLETEICRCNVFIQNNKV
jgi:hypothetical protein